MKRALLLLGITSAIAIAVLAFAFSRKQIQTNYGTATVLNGQKVWLEVARSQEAIVQGLSDRPSMNDDQGMLFVLPRDESQTFWMPRMKFDLDIIFLRQGIVVDLVTLSKPNGTTIPTYTSVTTSDMVLELTRGGSNRYGLEVGTKTDLHLFR